MQSALAKSGLEARYLELEITETVVMTATKLQLQILQELKDLGIKISLDDFGTGYSSLSYLTSFDFDIIKIDRSFVSGILESQQSELMIKSIVQLILGLNKKIVVEGVERKAQYDYLQDLGCHFVQGYLLGLPESAENADLQIDQKNKLLD